MGILTFYFRHFPTQRKSDINGFINLRRFTQGNTAAIFTDSETELCNIKESLRIIPMKLISMPLTLIIPGENRDFSGTEPLLDLRPVCKFKLVRYGPGENYQSALSFLVEAWRPDEVREHLFPNSEIEIFIDFCRFSKNFPNFQKIFRGPI